MNLCHIVKYYNTFFKFDNGPCFLELLPFVHENSPFLMGSGLLSPVILITTLQNKFTVFNTIKSSSSLIMMVYMALYHHKLLPFAVEKNHKFYDVLSLNPVILIRTASNLFTMLSTKMSFRSFNIVYIAKFLQELLPFVHEILPLFAKFIL